MPLIKCPNCGHDVSDKAVKCPHCGCSMKMNQSVNQNNLFQCPECGAMIDKNAVSCPNCGVPLQGNINNQLNQNYHQQPNPPQQFQMNQYPNNNSNNDDDSNKSWLVVLGFVIVILGGLAVFAFSNRMTKNPEQTDAVDSDTVAVDSVDTTAVDTTAESYDDTGSDIENNQQTESREEQVGEQVAEISANVISEWQGIVSDYNSQGSNAYQAALPTMKNMIDEMNQCISVI